MKLGPAEMFKVLGVETRIRIIELLKSKGSLGVKKIAEVLEITPAAVSQHLKVLRQAGLVSNERKGYWIPYSIDVEALENCRCIVNDVCICGCKGSVRPKNKEPNRATLLSLMKYERELTRELRNVQEMIAKSKRRKK